MISNQGTGPQTVNVGPEVPPRFRRQFARPLLALLALDMVVVAVGWLGGNQADWWQSVSSVLYALTVLIALLWLRLTRRVLGTLWGLIRWLFRAAGRTNEGLNRLFRLK